MHEGEVVEFLERLDIDFGERGELLLRVVAVLVGIEALDRHGGVELIEGPGMTNAGNAVIGPEHDLGANRSPAWGWAATEVAPPVRRAAARKVLRRRSCPKRPRGGKTVCSPQKEASVRRKLWRIWGRP